ncbi:MAG: hypothetical protein FWE46_01715 [Coriobacteriia bacterium]|nr:hypothetical protein [Coriobacteriia bacterium]MCL2537295.1 hypothetical protein [Coriobacteriia bacterium]
MDKYFDLKVIIPGAIGILIGGALFFAGLAGAGAAMSTLGLIFTTMFVMLAAQNAGAISRKLSLSIIMGFFGIGVIVMGVSLEASGELRHSPSLFPLAMVIGVGMFGLGVYRLFTNTND